MSTAGASILALGYLLPFFYLFWSLHYGALAGPNPWGATGLEWQTASPPPKDNFLEIPIVEHDAYAYHLQPPDEHTFDQVHEAQYPEIEEAKGYPDVEGV